MSFITLVSLLIGCSDGNGSGIEVNELTLRVISYYDEVEVENISYEILRDNGDQFPGTTPTEVTLPYGDYVLENAIGTFEGVTYRQCDDLIFAIAAPDPDREKPDEMPEIPIEVCPL